MILYWIRSIHIREHDIHVQEAMTSSHDEMNSPYPDGSRLHPYPAAAVYTDHFPLILHLSVVTVHSVKTSTHHRKHHQYYYNSIPSILLTHYRH